MTITATGLLFVVLCALGWSLLDLVRKRLAGSLGTMALVFYLTAGQVPLFVAWIWREPLAWPGSGYWLPAVASIALNVAANFAFVAALEASPISLTVPLLSLTPVFIALLAIPMLGEVPTPQQWLGIVMVVAGAALLHLPDASPGAAMPKTTTPAEGGVGGPAERGFGGPAESGVGGWWRAMLRERGSKLMILVALGWSLTLPLDKLAVRHATPAVHGLALTGGVAVATLFLLFARGRLRDLATARKMPLLLGAAVVCAAFALWTQLVGMQLVWVGLLESVKRGFGSLMALVWGSLLFAERVRSGQLFAVLLMAAGVVLVLT